MYDFKSKDAALRNNVNYSLSKTLSMFEWENLPLTIPVKELEKMLQVSGYAFITEHEGSLYCFTGGLGGVPDVYNNPTEIIVSNPFLNLNRTFNLETEGVLIVNDDMRIGLNPLLTKFNSMLVENDLSMIIGSYATRLQMMITANDDKTKASVDKFLVDLINGELAAIGESALFEGIKTPHISRTSNHFKSLIEYHQYIKASMYNELGLDAAFNMKRERLNTAEVGQNDDSLYPFIDNMMKCRLEGVTKLNEIYSLGVQVGYGSVWAVKNKRLVDGVVEESTESMITEGGEENVEENRDIANYNHGSEVDTANQRGTEEPTEESIGESTEESTEEQSLDESEESTDESEESTEESEESTEELAEEIEEGEEDESK